MTPPNIVLILVDDLGWRDLGCYGSTFHETPHIDALAAGGMRFTEAYAASPVCSPSRASLLSGKDAARVGITDWLGGQGVGRLLNTPYLRGLPENEYTLARALRAAGYRTWHVGKWHLGGGRSLPDHHGFDLNVAGSSRALPGSYVSPYRMENLRDGPDGEYLTDRLTDEAIALVDRAGDSPFFLNLWHYAVHTPIQAPAPLVEKYRAKARAMGLPEDAFEEGEPMAAWHLRGQRIRRRTLQSDPGYAAMVENLDANVGRLIEALRERGLLQNTVIVFTSDNGGLSTAEGSPTTNQPLREGKGWLHDGGLRVPLIVAGGGTIPGLDTETVTSTPDLFPTILELAGLPPLPAQHLDGRSIAGSLRGEVAAPHSIHWHYPHYSNQGGRPSSAVRSGRYKLIRDWETGHVALYDLDADTGEEHDLATTLPDVLAELTDDLDRWLTDVGALVPRPNPYPHPFDDPQPGDHGVSRRRDRHR